MACELDKKDSRINPALPNIFVNGIQADKCDFVDFTKIYIFSKLFLLLITILTYVLSFLELLRINLGQ